MEGEVFGRLTVISRASRPRHVKTKRPFWLCKCVCGAEKVVVGDALRSGNTSSCGCAVNRSRRQGDRPHVLHRRSYARAYDVWRSMVKRCCDPKDASYDNYGGRGIRVCDRWLEGVQNFIEDMGEHPEGTTIERIKNDDGYHPYNCRWASKGEQRLNTRRSKFITFGGKTQNVEIWNKELGFSRSVIQARLHRGWSVEKALTTPQGPAKRLGGRRAS